MQLRSRLKRLVQFNKAALPHFLYLFIVLLLTLLALLSVVFLLSQAVRTAPNKNWTKNVNVILIGAAYVLVLVGSLALCLKRRLSVRLKLARIPKGRIAIGKGDVPKVVHNYIEEELLRSCAISYASLPETPRRDGWGMPGTKYEDVRFRTAILDTVAPIDAVARAVIPSIPPLSPHVPLSRHLRHLLPLLSISSTNAPNENINANKEKDEELFEVEEEGATAGHEGPEVLFHRYTAAVEKARNSDVELSEEEFDNALEAATALKGILDAYKVMLSDQHAQ